MPLTDLPQIAHAQSHQFFLMAGPCAIEGDEMAMRIAEKIKSVTDALSIPFIFKGSFKKANRSRLDSFTGIGDEKAIKILEKVSKAFEVPTVTDIHSEEDAEMAALMPDHYACKFKKSYNSAPWSKKNNIIARFNDKILIQIR